MTTEERKYTRGPWKAYKGPLKAYKGPLNPFFKGLVAVLSFGVGDDSETVAVITEQDIPAFDFEANANLMAKAPELLEELEAQICHGCDNRIGYNPIGAIAALYHCDACAKARALIASARGQAVQS